MKRKEQQSRDEMFQDWKHQIKGMQQQKKNEKRECNNRNKSEKSNKSSRRFSAWIGAI